MSRQTLRDTKSKSVKEFIESDDFQLWKKFLQDQAKFKEKDRIIKIIKEVMDEGSYYRKELLKELKRGGGGE